MNDAEIEHLGRVVVRSYVPSGESIFVESESDAFCASIVSGIVKLEKSLPDGRQQIVGLRFNGEFLGRPDNAGYDFAARAVTETQLCRAPKRQFQALMKRFPALEDRLFRNVLEKLDWAREWILLLGRKTAEERVASFILFMAKNEEVDHHGSGDRQDVVRVELFLSRSEIADFLGITSETVSRALTRIQDRGIISIEPGRVASVASLAKLAAVAQQAHTDRYSPRLTHPRQAEKQETPQKHVSDSLHLI